MENEKQWWLRRAETFFRDNRRLPRAVRAELRDTLDIEVWYSLFKWASL